MYKEINSNENKSCIYLYIFKYEHIAFHLSDFSVLRIEFYYFTVPFACARYAHILIYFTQNSFACGVIGSKIAAATQHTNMNIYIVLHVYEYSKCAVWERGLRGELMLAPSKGCRGDSFACELG